MVGADPELTNVVKLSGNFMIMSAIESLGEALALTRKYGIDPAFSVDLLTSTLFNAPVYKTYGNLIAREQFDPPGFHCGWDSKTCAWRWRQRRRRLYPCR